MDESLTHKNLEHTTRDIRQFLRVRGIDYAIKCEYIEKEYRNFMDSKQYIPFCRDQTELKFHTFKCVKISNLYRMLQPFLIEFGIN